MKARFLGSLLICIVLLPCSHIPALADRESHGLSSFNNLKYPPDFSHFSYVNPSSKKGGIMRLHSVGSFDNLNPYILKGTKLRGIAAHALSTLPFDSLLERAWDEPDTMYGLLAEKVEITTDRSEITFTLRPEARFNDGSPLTADDVIFSFNILKKRGLPQFRIVLRDVEKVSSEASHRVTFKFRHGAQSRNLPLIIAGLPIFSKAYYSSHNFDQTTLLPPLGSGPYNIVQVDQGRSLTYKRVVDYWGKDLPVNRGRYNFDTIRFDFYRDRNIAMEAFKSGEYDFREEHTSKMWSTSYKFDGLYNGLAIREALVDQSPTSRQYFILNLRRELFKDPRAREAINLAFDFEWTNKNIFYGLYTRAQSLFNNTPMAARMLPSEKELSLLVPLRKQLPEEVFTKVFHNPSTDGSGNNRKNLRRAVELFKEAGYLMNEGKLTTPSGHQVSLEYLTFSPSFERVIAPFVKNLKRIGINARIRIVDTAQYSRRMHDFDFDMASVAFASSAIPDSREQAFWGSESAYLPGSTNYAGVSDPAVDILIKTIKNANDKETLHAAARALDRVLLWNRYVIPAWFSGKNRFAYWNKFSRPAKIAKYDPYFGYIDTWWIDAKKVGQIEVYRSN